MSTQQFKVRGNDEGGYDVLANDGPRTRYFLIGTVTKAGRKWETDDGIEHASKKIAVAAITGTYLITSAAAQHADEDRDAANEAAPCLGEKWPEDAPTLRGNLIKHTLGYKGRAEYCRRSKDGKTWRVGLRTQAGKALVIGTWGKEVEHVVVGD